MLVVVDFDLRWVEPTGRLGVIDRNWSLSSQQRSTALRRKNFHIQPLAGGVGDPLFVGTLVRE